MLILTRNISKSIIINEETVVTILSVNGNQVKLGINAPKEVPVHRYEIHQRIQQERLNKQGKIIP